MLLLSYQYSTWCCHLCYLLYQSIFWSHHYCCLLLSLPFPPVNFWFLTSFYCVFDEIAVPIVALLPVLLLLVLLTLLLTVLCCLQHYYCCSLQLLFPSLPVQCCFIYIKFAVSIAAHMPIQLHLLFPSLLAYCSWCFQWYSWLLLCAVVTTISIAARWLLLIFYRFCLLFISCSFQCCWLCCLCLCSLLCWKLLWMQCTITRWAFNNIG